MLIRTINTLTQVLSAIWTENIPRDRCLYFFSGILWQLRKLVGKGEYIKKISNGTLIPCMPTQAYSVVHYFRWPESKDILFLRRNYNIFSAENFVDVGANVGLVSAHLFDLFKKFYLFEPAQSSYHALLMLQKLNPDMALNIYNIAVGSFCGEIQFMDEGNHSGTSRVVKSKTEFTRQVPIRSLDEILLSAPGLFVVKVDVEGLEEDVFKGASELFKTGRVAAVMFERLGRTNLENIERFFKSLSMCVFYVRKDGSISTQRVDIEKPLENLFACPENIFSLLIYRNCFHKD